MRVFICSNRKYLGNVGGGGGVNYRLAKINSFNKPKVEVINVFSDYVVNASTFKEVAKENISSKAIKRQVRDILYSLPFIIPIVYNRNIRRAEVMLKKANEIYAFKENDVFYFHDLESVQAFKRNWSFRNTVLVYHHQGSLYNEWESYTGKASVLLNKWIVNYMMKAFNSANYWGFPSIGARESLVDSEPNLKDFVMKHSFEVFYNGMNCEIVNERIAPQVENIIKEIKQFNGFVFTTISAVSEAKGVDRIPKFLSLCKKNGVNFKWILVGNGAKAELLEKEIKVHNIEEDTIWFRERVEHDDILRLLSESTFYIMFHRFSIFDFATIEAMSCGCIPVLTAVGGNKEVVFENSGCFVENPSEVEPFIDFLENVDLDELKCKNIEIQANKFSEKVFFEKYIEFARSLVDGKENE